MADDQSALRELAREEGLLTTYTDAFGEERTSPPESLVSVLRGIGVAIESAAAAEECRRERAHRRSLQVGPASVVVWAGTRPRLRLRLPAARVESALRLTLTTEAGEALEREIAREALRVTGEARVDGRHLLDVEVPIAAARAQPLKLGLHRLAIEPARGERFETQLIVAPRSAWPLEGRTWGVFAPLYALRTRQSLGVGDLDDLGALTDAVGRLGGGCVATLPLLDCFRDEPFDPSPYAPVSRLFWDPLYLDVDSIPEAEGLGDAALRLGTARAAREAQAAVSSKLVDHRRVMTLKRGMLDACARRLFTLGGPRLEAFERFLRESPRILDYARFRATGERLRAPWPRWPGADREGVVRRGGLDDERVRFHAYVQWIWCQQLAAVANRARSIGPGLLLDFPAGVHAHGYDTWRMRGSFVDGCSLGAPPDQLFQRGQDWGLAALAPSAVGHGGLAYFRDALATQMTYAGVLRIDHVMGLERQFVIPAGASPVDGVYVRMPRDELLALVCLESRRRRSAVVGEDLGTVPAGLRAEMKRRGLLRIVALQLELRPRARDPLPRALPEDAVATWGTHDMPTFAGFLEARDLADWEDLGLLDGEQAAAARVSRSALVARLSRALTRKPAARPEVLLAACWKWLAASRSKLVIVSLEDLWLEREPQNVPGTGAERPNWVRRMRHALEDVLEHRDWLERFRVFRSARRPPRT